MNKCKKSNSIVYIVYFTLILTLIIAIVYEMLNSKFSFITAIITLAAIATLIFSFIKYNNENCEADIDNLEKQLSQIFYPLISILSKIKIEENNIQFHDELDKILNLRSILNSSDRTHLEKLQIKIKSDFDIGFINSEQKHLEDRKNEIENKLDELKKIRYKD